MMAFEGGVLGSIYKPQVLLHFRLIQENLRVGLDLVDRTGEKSSGGIYIVEQTDVVVQTGYVDLTG